MVGRAGNADLVCVEVGVAGGAVAAEGGCVHHESGGTGLAFLDVGVPESGEMTGHAISEVVEVRGGSWADAGEGGGVEDEVGWAGDAGGSLGIPDCGGRALDAEV